MNNQILNAQVLRADERLGAIDWPVLREIDIPTVGLDDCVLVCAGFEDRAIETLNRICESGRIGVSIGVIDYRPSYPQNKRERILEISQKANFRTKEFIYDRENPMGIGEKLYEFTKDANRVFIDISGMSRLLIVQILVALFVPNSRPITIIYSEAKNYPPSEQEFSQDQRVGSSSPLTSYLSSGIFEIAVTPELSSVSMLGASIRLVAFPSLDHAQLNNLLHELQPTYTDIIHGIPPEEKNKWRIEAIRKLNKSNFDSLQKPNYHDASTLDYRETLNLLLNIYNNRSMFDRIVVAPIGSKMQAVAVGLFRAVLYDIQIVYPTPQIFTEPSHYTIGVRQLYAIDLPENIIENDKGTISDPAVQEQGSG